MYKEHLGFRGQLAFHINLIPIPESFTLLDRDELLEQSVKYLMKTFSKKGKFDVNKEVLNKIKYLKKAFEMEEAEIFQAIFDYYMNKEMLEIKYNSDNALSTFVAHCCNNILSNLKKKEKCINDRGERSLDAMIDGGFIEPVENANPENLLLTKELEELIFEHFGATDALVVRGYEDLKKTAMSLGMSYDAYRKRLQRKKNTFKAFLEKHGYTLH